ncbi:MAG: Dabb family protein [Bacteroidota bacterium]
MNYLLSIAAAALLMVGCTQSSGTQNPEVEQAHFEEGESTLRQTDSDKRQLRHVVLFKFKESASPEDIAKVEAAFNELPAKIPEIKGFEWGTNNSPEGLDKGFTHCFFLSFDDEEGRAIYLPHPDHKAFGETLGPYLEDVLVVDYWTD